MALAAGLGAARLAETPGAAHVLLPIAACVVTGHLVVSLVRYLRMPDPVPSVTGVLAVGLMAVWTLLPKATRWGIPTWTTVRSLLHHFSAAGAVIRAHPTPVPATSGVVLCLAAGAGIAAVFARTLWSWQEIRPPGARRPLVALFPTFGLFCYTALLSSDIDRVTGTAFYLAAALLFLAVADRPARPGAGRHGTRGRRRRWPWPPPPSSSPWSPVPGSRGSASTPSPSPTAPGRSDRRAPAHSRAGRCPAWGP